MLNDELPLLMLVLLQLLRINLANSLDTISRTALFSSMGSAGGTSEAKSTADCNAKGKSDVGCCCCMRKKTKKNQKKTTEKRKIRCRSKTEEKEENRGNAIGHVPCALAANEDAPSLAAAVVAAAVALPPLFQNAQDHERHKRHLLPRQ